MTKSSRSSLLSNFTGAFSDSNILCSTNMYPSPEQDISSMFGSLMNGSRMPIPTLSLIIRYFIAFNSRGVTATFFVCPLPFQSLGRNFSNKFKLLPPLPPLPLPSTPPLPVPLPLRVPLKPLPLPSGIISHTSSIHFSRMYRLSSGVFGLSYLSTRLAILRSTSAINLSRFAKTEGSMGM